MHLTAQLIDYLAAAFSGIWIQTLEPDEAEREIIQLARQNNWKVATWDVANGLRLPMATGTARPDAGAGDPLAALRALPALADPNGTALLVLHNFHRFLGNAETVQATFSQLIQGKQQRTFLVVLSPTTDIPLELQKVFVIVEHALPDRAQVQQIARELTADHSEEMPKGDDLQRVLDAAMGLTRYEAESSMALSLARHSAIRPEVIWDLKAQALRKNNLLTLHRGRERFDTLGGLANLKYFCGRALLRGRPVKPKGVLLVGVPGTGKSAFARSLGSETGRPTLILDIGALYGSLVGATEQNVRQALRIADAMAPCILFVDELDKSLSGIGGQGDSGVATRLFGTLLTWLADHESDVFFIGTANDISKLPPEFTRAERLDAVFFLDVPSAEERKTIWDLYRRQFQLDDSQKLPDDADWTGAEIRSCCRLAALLDLPLAQAARQVVPVAVTAAEQIERLRSWASGRCLSASASGLYAHNSEATARGGRRVQRPSTN
ncbi:MAG: AAA family ATPase [Planctomycetia bacterium]|nr:AAA family ATPase [Planctomycetia bacterium]